MVTQAQLDELGTKAEQDLARNLTEQFLQKQGINLSTRSAGTQRLFQLFINEPQAVLRQRASGSIGQTARGFQAGTTPLVSGTTSQIDSGTPVASAIGGGYITAGGDIIRGTYGGGIEAHRLPSGYVPPPISQQDLISFKKFKGSEKDLLSLSTPVASAIGGGYITAGGDIIRGTPYLGRGSGIELSKTTGKEIKNYQKQQQEFYREKIEGEINRINNWDRLPSYQREEIYNRIYGKYNSQYQKVIGEYSRDLIEKDLKKQYPDFELAGMSTPTGVSFSLIPKEGTEDVTAEPPIGSISALGLRSFETYKKGEAKVSGSIKKWMSKTKKILKDIINNEEAYSIRTRNVAEEKLNAIDKLETGEGLTDIEQQLLNTPIKTIIEFGITGAINPALLIGGIGVLQQPELGGKISNVGKYVEETGEFLQQVPDFDKIGFVTEIGGKGIRGAGSVVSETTTSEDLLFLASLEKGLKIVPRVVRSVGLKGLGGYEAYTGITDPTLTEEERYGKFLISGLAFAGSIPDDIVLARKIRFKLGGVDKTKIGDLGIQKTDIDLGKFSVDLHKGVGELKIDPLRLEYIPSQKEVFTKRLDVLELMSKDIPLKDKFKLPNIKNRNQKIILDVVKKNDDIITGSFSSESMVKGSRKWKTDLDIISRNPQKNTITNKRNVRR